MVNPVDIGLRIAQALDGIGIKMGSYIGKSSNVKKAMFGGKSTMFKPNAIQSLRGEGKNFEDALKLIEEEAQFIVNASDAEKMAFLNNLNDYKDLGGPLKKDLVASKQFEEGIGTLKDDIESLQTTAKTMKDDAEKGLKSAEDDLKTFLETGGNPLKKKEPKYLGGSMHEEGQLRTAIRTFLKNEFKNGRIKLDETDKFRVMEYSPMMEDDPIKVFKKIYGDEAYKRAGTFPGAFEIGESFNHYESIFRSKMGEDILKVKDKKYVGDGTLVLTDEVKTPTPDDDDMPFAEGGRASFAGGGGLKRIVQEIVEYITTKFTPMDAMKEINKVIGKTGKYKNLKLTDDDINDIVEGTNDFVFQRDPDNLFVEGSIKERTKYFDDADEAGTFFPKTSKDKSIDEMSIEETLETAEGLGATKMAERFRLKQKYPGLDDDLLTNIIEDTDPVHKASVLAKIDMAMELGKTNKSAEEIIDILKKEPETKMATGGRAGFDKGGSVIKLLDGTTVQIPAGSYGKYGLKDYIYSSSKGDLTKDEIIPLLVPSGASYATGGRAGYYGGGQAMIEPDLSDIGHGSDALMARTRLTAPGSQATTSTGLNYLLGEDNDNIRVPFQGGGGADASTTSFSKSFDKQHGTNTVSRANKTVDARQAEGQRGADRTNERMQNTNYFVGETEPSFNVKAINAIDKANNLNKFYNFATTLNPLALFKSNPYAFAATGILSLNERRRLEKLREEQENSLQPLAEGGVAGLRQGYVGGGGVNLARRGFLKVLGGTVGAIAAFKTGALKLLGKTTTKAAPKLFTAAEGSGAPAWFEGMVNKVLADGVDITKKAATMDGQTVKSLDTPTGKVDVTIDRTGNIDVNYMGDNTAMGEGVDMRYTVGQADETTKVKPFDEFEAVENIPEGQMSSPNDYNVEFAENATSDVKNLYSDTSELAELGGQKPLIKDISTTIKKKQTLKKMNENPDEFASDNLRDDFPDYDYGDVDPN